jgi:uncharacterized membrane protein
MTQMAETSILRRAAGDTTAPRQVAWSIGLALVGGLVAAAFLPWSHAALVGWDVGAAVYLALVWTAIRPLDAQATHDRARRLEPGRGFTDGLVVVAAVGVIAALVAALFAAGRSHNGSNNGLLFLGLLSVGLGWLSLHTAFTLRYARLYYGDPEGGVDFKQPEPPDFLDFAYLAFTVGMTFQVSDTDLTQSSIRHTVLRHGLMSYAFGAVILGLVINIVAGLL